LGAMRGRRSRPPILVIQHDDYNGPGQLAQAAEEAGLELDVRTIHQGANIPPDLGPAAGLVILGGAIGVGDAPTHPHLYEEMRLIRTAARRGEPVLGLCLGAQLAAEALGGRVHRGEAGIEIGWIELGATEVGREDPVVGALGGQAVLFEWHRDTYDAPPGSLPLVVGERYPSQGFRLGSVVAVQAHPEVEPSTIARWCEHPLAGVDMAEARVTRDDLMEGAVRRAGLAKRLLDAWCTTVMEGCRSRVSPASC
jgi:GMP synthase (glutamine-hydrolysing)